ncbi:acetyl-CoA carboxylase biotin carboxylase subunit [Sediminitomix flava]|uniref:acetyl-CoA carboxylase biotin carboxylase subunit n=1 Tax=Sediminitomix flava TaxID=379075 RepID=UPI000D6B548C|nr:acetyl-CoA carboxylase biotin carboxylase subunit [Sediminitomix flava]
MKNIKKVLIANRGEIALRIIRSIKELGIKSVAVFSEVDRTAPHVLAADEAVCLGGNTAAESYLDIQKILNIAKELNIDAIHPGYGFLSENADFAQKVEDAGIIFIGPSASSIQIMGSKIEAKNTVKAYNIPLVPGIDEATQDLDVIRPKINEIGFPLLIKASAGGGGKGMRIVETEEEFEEQLERAISEAKAAFGDGTVFVEKYITSPKHIEFQILADKHGNVVHLFERECSIQRRHQKVIEEAPSIFLDEKLRAEMGKCAVDVAKSCNYVGAGTVEFIMDSNKNYYFLEMNTRLQVEHAVTEEITDVDLVKEQIKVSDGHPLSFTQDDLKINGHAIEIRVYAEDSENGFMPDTGTLSTYQIPQGYGTRVDDGYQEGNDVSIYYDPMISKLIVRADNRDNAIDKALRSIDEYIIAGVKTTLPFASFAINHEAFRTGNFDTNFISKYYSKDSLKQTMENDEEFIASGIAGLLFNEENKNIETQHQTEGTVNKWKTRAK